MEQIGQRDDSSDRVDRCPQMRIFSGPLSMFGAKVELAARKKGIAFELLRLRRFARKSPQVGCGIIGVSAGYDVGDPDATSPDRFG
jgi:hypothetical protein